MASSTPFNFCIYASSPQKQPPARWISFTLSDLFIFFVPFLCLTLFCFTILFAACISCCFLNPLAVKYKAIAAKNIGIIQSNLFLLIYIFPSCLILKQALAITARIRSDVIMAKV